MLSAYREAFEHHVDNCDRCSWPTLDLCHIGKRLRDAYALRAAQLLAPIPSIQRSAVKA